MKILVSLLAFVLILGLSYSTLAGEAGGEGTHHPDMNALFPPKKPDFVKTFTPFKPVLVEPQFMATVNGDKANLKWNEAKDAENYQVQVATDPNFKWLVLENNAVRGTSLEVSGLEKGKKYYWRVRSQRMSSDSGYQHSMAAWSAFVVQ